MVEIGPVNLLTDNLKLGSILKDEIKEAKIFFLLSKGYKSNNNILSKGYKSSHNGVN